MKKYCTTMAMSARQTLNCGLGGMLPTVLVRLAGFVPLLVLWRVILRMGVSAELSMDQMMTYTYVSCLLADLLNPQSPASSWLYEGLLQQLYQRPMSILGHLTAQTVGGWLPMLGLFSLPMALVAPLFGISLCPVSWWFLPSLLSAILLGFAIEYLFVCLAIRLKGMGWLACVIRAAITSVLSGAVIPFQFMPFGLSRILALQPFGSLGGAVLSIYTGAADPVYTVLVQLGWNVLLWPLAVFVFRRSRERLLSYGG